MISIPADERADRLETAERLIASGDDRDLIYAALELRQLIEYLVYRKLAAYSTYVPESVSSTWQPPQAMKALLRLEPDADKNFTLKVSFDAVPGAEDEATWVELGEHIALDSKWLTTNYNRLGSYIHFPHGRPNGHDFRAMRTGITEIYAELQRVSEANILSFSGGERVSFVCRECDQQVFVNTDLLKEDGRTVCFNSNCGARYLATHIDGEWCYRKETVDVPCPECGSMMFLPVHKIQVNAVFLCRECNARTRVALALGIPDAAQIG
ncbi:MAG: hypothetical protein Q8K89_12435 [Actinomycetota bacterium]|nr:hypothetical protein [Actinomycetota bacterium]